MFNFYSAGNKRNGYFYVLSTSNRDYRPNWTYFELTKKAFCLQTLFSTLEQQNYWYYEIIVLNMVFKFWEFLSSMLTILNEY